MISLKKLGAIAGIAFPILQLISQGFMQVGGMEPSFSAPAAEIVAFFQNRDPALFAFGNYLSILSVVAFLWFLGVLWDYLWTADGDTNWLATIAIGSGLVVASALAGTGGWPLAIFRINEGLEPQIARMLFDEGNLNFANIWVPIGSMVLTVGLVGRQSNRFPTWLGWGSIVLALGLFLARIAWASGIAFIPYGLFWLWMITLGVILLRHFNAQTQVGYLRGA